MQQSIPIKRPRLESALRQGLHESPATVLLGARQTGKTTLARSFTRQLTEVHYFDLERAADRAALSTPELTLRELTGTIVIDEVQRIPELFEILRPLCDRPDEPSRFLLLGSASPDLTTGVSESLAGRVHFVPVPGFSLEETGGGTQSRLWLRGGFPRSFLAESDEASFRWREDFARTFLERDMPQLGIRVPAETLRRFWTMLCHYHGQVWNGSELARSIGVTLNTVRHYLDILCGGYVVRVLLPWYENVKKRQVKSPKVYVRDCGLLHYLLGMDTMSALRSNPRYGASWEGFALEQALVRFGEGNAIFWRTQRGAELDLLLLRGGKRIGFEFKCCDAPTMSKSMHIALQDLGLSMLHVVYPGTESYPLHERVMAVPLDRLDRLDLAGEGTQTGEKI